MNETQAARIERLGDRSLWMGQSTFTHYATYPHTEQVVITGSASELHCCERCGHPLGYGAPTLVVIEHLGPRAFAVYHPHCAPEHVTTADLRRIEEEATRKRTAQELGAEQLAMF